MKLPLLLVAGSLLALALVAPTASAWPPVCIEKGADAPGVSVDVMLTCGVEATVTRCPVVGDGPCYAYTVDPLG